MTKEKVFISEADQYLFAQGTHYDIYKKLGAHLSVGRWCAGSLFRGMGTKCSTGECHRYIQ